jgi:hypothetical protein
VTPPPPKVKARLGSNNGSLSAKRARGRAAE